MANIIASNAIEFVDVSFRYESSAKALNRVSFACPIGTVCAVIGPSGSGKTTILRLAAGLESPNSGRVVVSTGEKSGHPYVAYVSQHLDLWPHLSILQNVALALEYGKLRRQRSEAQSMAAAVLDRLGLGQYLSRYPNEVSGGQRQRVAIGRAMAVNPSIMLLDEITAALDPETASEVLRSLIELKPSDQTVVFVTHHLGFAGHHADMVIFLDGGSILETIAGEALMDSARTDRLRDFVRHYR